MAMGEVNSVGKAGGEGRGGTLRLCRINSMDARLKDETSLASCKSPIAPDAAGGVPGGGGGGGGLPKCGP